MIKAEEKNNKNNVVKGIALRWKSIEKKSNLWSEIRSLEESLLVFHEKWKTLLLWSFDISSDKHFFIRNLAWDLVLWVILDLKVFKF